LVRDIAKEERRHSVRDNTVLIGVIEAGMFRELARQGVFDRQWIDETQKLLAIKRLGRPEEIRHAVVFLASTKVPVAGGFGI